MKIIRYADKLVNLAEVRNIEPRIFGKTVDVFFFFKNSNDYACIKIPTAELISFIDKCYEIMTRED